MLFGMLTALGNGSLTIVPLRFLTNWGRTLPMHARLTRAGPSRDRDRSANGTRATSFGLSLHFSTPSTWASTAQPNSFHFQRLHTLIDPDQCEPKLRCDFVNWRLHRQTHTDGQ